MNDYLRNQNRGKGERDSSTKKARVCLCETVYDLNVASTEDKPAMICQSCERGKHEECDGLLHRRFNAFEEDGCDCGCGFRMSPYYESDLDHHPDYADESLREQVDLRDNEMTESVCEECGASLFGIIYLRPDGWWFAGGGFHPRKDATDAAKKEWPGPCKGRWRVEPMEAIPPRLCAEGLEAYKERVSSESKS